MTARRPRAADREAVAAAILARVAARGPGRTLCPSEVAKALAAEAGAGDDWRAWLKPVRAEAVALAGRGRVTLYRKGRPVADPAAARGVIRLGPPAAAQT